MALSGDEIPATETPVAETAVTETPAFEAEDATDTGRESLTKKIWGFGVRHVVFMALGAALYAGVSYVTNSLQLPGASNVSLRPGIVIPLFFGAVFGPWVGLFTGLVGNSINDLLTGGIYWNWEIGIGLIGFITSLVIYFTRGRYNTAIRILLAEAFSVLGLVVGLAFASILDIWASQMTFKAVITTEFFPALIPDLVLGLILLPILLVAYEAAVARTGRS
ncbi:MAG TPA: ECF transporter S component [Ktedonobacteraceae bacterium]